MIARVWQGWTHVRHAADYLAFLKTTVAKEMHRLPGYRGFHVFTSEETDKTRFLVFSMWDSLESIRAFAGEDIEQARIYPETREYFVEYERQVKHLDVAYFHTIEHK
jgi:heme-degrading monooxygenase HmoA